MKKSISVLAVLLLIMLTLVGCKDNNTETTPTPAPTVTGSAGDPYQSSFLKAGETIKIWQWWNKKDEDAFPGDDIYSKNKRETVDLIESTNGITIEFVVVDDADQWSAVRSAAAQGAPIADGMHGGGTPLILDNYYYNDLPGNILANLLDYESDISFKDPALFDQDAQEKYCTFNGNLYFFVPKQVGKTSVYMQQACFFNYNLLTQIGVEPTEVYQAVKDKTWNWTMFEDIATRATNTASQVWGFTRGAGGSSIYNLITSNGAEVVGSREVDGKMIDRFVMMEPKAVKAVDFYTNLYQNKKCIDPKDNGNNDALVVAEFASNQLAFMFTYLQRADGLVDEETGMKDGSKYGIVPIPMGPDADRYYAETNWIEPYAMFKDAMNPQGTLFVMQQLYKPVYPAGSADAEELFKVECGQWCADENAMEMIKLIRDSNVYTKHGVYSWTDSYKFLFTALMADQDILDGATTASEYYTSIESAMNELIDSVNRLK